MPTKQHKDLSPSSPNYYSGIDCLGGHWFSQRERESQTTRKSEAVTYFTGITLLHGTVILQTLWSPTKYEKQAGAEQCQSQAKLY